jgi:hypothetical protein
MNTGASGTGGLTNSPANRLLTRLGRSRKGRRSPSEARGRPFGQVSGRRAQGRGCLVPGAEGCAVAARGQNRSESCALVVRRFPCCRPLNPNCTLAVVNRGGQTGEAVFRLHSGGLIMDDSRARHVLAGLWRAFGGRTQAPRRRRD